MKRQAILLLLLFGGCDPPMMPGTAQQPREELYPFVFAASKAAPGDSDAAMSEFHYLTYDHALGCWSGELGGTAVLEEDGLFRPADAIWTYWPEGKIYSFFAVGHNEKQPVPSSSVEFGSSVMLYGSGSSALLQLRNPSHDVDWLAAQAFRQQKRSGVSLEFRHVTAHIGKLSFDLSEYRNWVREKELDISALESLGCTLSDADEQSFIFSANNSALFKKESWDYGSSPGKTLDGRRSLAIMQGSCSAEVSYYAFPGIHRLTMHLRLLDGSGRQVVDDRELSGSLTLPMGSDCELRIKLKPNDRSLDVEVLAGLPGWDSSKEGTVSE